MSGPPRAGVAAQVVDFFSNWEVYQAVLHGNCMEHAEIFAAVGSALRDRVGPVRMLDLGCGDGWAVRPALAGVGIAAYVAVDSAAPALELARSNLAHLAGRLECRVADMLDVLESDLDSYDVILASFVVHHLSGPDKQRFFDLARARLAPGGELLFIDVVRLPGQTRAAYIDRYRGLIAGWAVSPEVQQRVISHVVTADFPEEVADVLAMAHRSGLTRVEQFYAGVAQTQGGWRLGA